MTKTYSDLEKKANRAIWQYAFMRLESAIVIGGTILLSFFYKTFMPSWWPEWGWPALGALALLLLVVSTVTDKHTRVKVQSELLHESFNPRKLDDPRLRHELGKALEYQQSIRTHIASSQRSGVLKEPDGYGPSDRRLGEQYLQTGGATGRYQHDQLLVQERNSVPRELETLASRRSEADNPEVQLQLDEVIASKRKQWESLSALDERMQQAELQLEQSTTALATVYTSFNSLARRTFKAGVPSACARTFTSRWRSSTIW
jgi:hypothetical protein